MNERDLLNIVGHLALDGFHIDWNNWIAECKRDNDGDIDPYATAMLFYGAGYVARQNDENQEHYERTNAHSNDARMLRQIADRIDS